MIMRHSFLDRTYEFILRQTNNNKQIKSLYATLIIDPANSAVKVKRGDYLDYPI